MNGDETEENVKPEAKMAERFAKYGDLIVAFVVLQSLTFCYALGQRDTALRNSIVNGRPTILWFVVGAGLFYSGLIWFCFHWEQSLRYGAGHDSPVLAASRAAAFGRAAVIVVACFVAWYGLYLNKT